MTNVIARLQRAGATVVTIALVALVAAGAPACSKAKKDAIALTNQGVRSYDGNDFKTAYVHFQRATEIWPEAVEAYYHMGLIDLHERQDLDAALANFTKARELAPGDRDVLFQLARLHEDKGNVKEALEAVEAVLKVDPNYAPAHHVRGTVLKKHGDFDGADGAFREAIACDPKYGRSYEALAQMYEEFEHESEARAVYEEALRHAERSPDVLNNLGVLKLQGGDAPGAIDLFREAMMRDATRTDALFNVAYAYTQAGQLSKAIGALESYEKNADPSAPNWKETVQTARAMRTALQTELNSKGEAEAESE